MQKRVPFYKAKHIMFVYSRIQQTLPKCSLLIHWNSVRFYEMGDMYFEDPLEKLGLAVDLNYKHSVFYGLKGCRK